MKRKLTALERLNWRGVPMAYVSSNGARRLPRQGSSAYHNIFVGTPIGARYAVAESSDLFFVFDLWKTKEVMNPAITFIPDECVEIYHDLDHAIGATVMKYDNMSLFSRWITPLIVAIWKEWRDK
jgi:hypothetical protein